MHTIENGSYRKQYGIPACIAFGIERDSYRKCYGILVYLRRCKEHGASKI